MRLVVAAALSLALAACSGLPPWGEVDSTPAAPDTMPTRLGRATAPELAAHPGQSAFYPVADGADAFVARVALARAADRALDVQYYIFHADDTGGALLGEFLAAADRGVRVRLLLDDIHIAGRDGVLAALDSHPNVEVRLFNPFAHRSARWIDGLTDFSRVNRRMHNKSLSADRQVTIVGGRNVGDEYFAATTGVEFGDFDVLAFGPVVGEVVSEFDQYWNSEVVYPIAALAGAAPVAGGLDALRSRLAAHLQALRGTPYARGLEETDLARSIGQRRLALHWGSGVVIADQPEKVRLPTADTSTHAAPRLRRILDGARRELLLVSPYFVPGTDGVRWLEGVVRRGVRVRVLTNSFAATDVAAVHAGYASYREALLRAGIELHELKPSAVVDEARRERRQVTGASRSSLHAKTYMVDRSTLFVGSFNLDPRSAFLNTEMGVVIESESLSRMLGDRLLERLADIAYRVELDRGTGRPVWITRESGREARYDAEPGMGPLQAMMQMLLRILPIEEQL